MDPAQMQEGAPEDAGAGAGADDADPQANAEPTEESGDGAGAGEGAPQDDQGSESDEVELVVAGEAPDDEKPPKDNAGWVKARQRERDLKAEAAELKRRLAAYEQPAGAPDPGPKPTLADCNFDEGEFETKLDAWKDASKRKAEHDAKAAQEAQAAQRSWQATQENFAKQEAELSKRLPGYANARRAVESMFSKAQQTVILKYAKNAPLVIAALGSDPKKAEALSSDGDLISLGIKVRELEATLSTKPKNKPPTPERRISGSGSNSAGADSQLEKLREKAREGGDVRDFTEVIAYKEKQARR